MGYEAHAPSFLLLLLAVAAVAVASIPEELREKWDRLTKKIAAKMVKP